MSQNNTRMKYNRLPLLLLLALAACNKGPQVKLQPWNSYRNPVVQSDLQDPAFLASEGKYYVFYNGSTEDEVLPVMESTDLVHWEPIAPVFDALTFPEALGSGTLSSCSAARSGEGFVLYFTCTNGASSLIGMAHAELPTGPWTYVGSVVSTLPDGTTGLSDPFYFESGNGKYLILKASNGLWCVSLNSEGTGVASAVKLTDAVLGSPVVYQKAGKYYLVATSGDEKGGSGSRAKVVYAISSQPDGPYTTLDGDVLSAEHYETLLSGGTKFAGPGGCAALLDLPDGTSWLLYNAYDLSDLSRGRTLMLDPVLLRGGGLQIRGGICSFCTEMPVTGNA